MTALAKALSETQVWDMAPSLRGLRRREGKRPLFDPTWPCLQCEDWASPEHAEKLAKQAASLPGSRASSERLRTPGAAFVLDEACARGQPEAFISGSAWLILSADGAMHLALRPEWAQRVLTLGWATVHPFARYMAGAVPPQSLIVYAPRTSHELRVSCRIMQAAHGYAMGRIGDVILPDTRW